MKKIKQIINLLKPKSKSEKHAKARIKVELVVDVNNELRFDFEGNGAEISALLLTAATHSRGFQKAMINAYGAFMKLVEEKKREEQFIRQCQHFINQNKN